MIIKEIRTHLLSVPFADPPKTGFLTLPAIDLLVVEVETRDGVVGTGHLHPLAGGMRTLDTCIHEMLKPLLIGQDAADPAALWQKMWLATFIQGRMGLTVMAMSALDIALWDAVGRERGQPLWRLWGGRGDPLPAYGSGCFRGLGHDGMIDKAERFVAQGFTAIKMQVAHLFTHDEDVANVRDMRAALGPDIEIMVDVNQGWTADEAIEVGRRLDEHRLHWLEEPVMADDFDGYARVAAAIRTPVVGGENNFCLPDMRPFFDAGRADPAARHHARRLYRTPPHRRGGAQGRHHDRAAHVPGASHASRRLDPEPLLAGIHGLVRPSLGRAGAAEERHDGTARPARARHGLPARTVPRPSLSRLSDARSVRGFTAHGRAH